MPVVKGAKRKDKRANVDAVRIATAVGAGKKHSGSKPPQGKRVEKERRKRKANRRRR